MIFYYFYFWFYARLKKKKKKGVTALQRPPPIRSWFPLTYSLSLTLIYIKPQRVAYPTKRYIIICVAQGIKKNGLARASHVRSLDCVGNAR